MSSNKERTYDSIYLKKTSYNTFNGKSLLKVFKVKDGKNKGKYAHVTIKINKNGKKTCTMVYKDFR